ncbi:MAG: ATP-grasp domain-containing protein [Candidatus Tectomicrobia bacterium]|nr:ATP-grasp domain-containing protein [Candidatus Tectomicrobia bacterium]
MSSSIPRRRVLLLYATTGYQAEDFLRAACGLGVETLIGTDRCHRLDDPWRDGAIALRFEDAKASLRTIVEEAGKAPIDAIVPVGDRPTVVAALAAQALGLPHNPPEAARACRNKFLSRCLLREAGLRVPAFSCHQLGADPREVARETRYPCVLKPLALSGSRGVIRADDEREFVAAFQRLKALLQTPGILALREEANEKILVEGFIEGREVVLEGLLDRGRLRTLALFDKPDPLDGPFFEETLYVTPSRLEGGTQEEVARGAEEAARSLGLFQGPIHAELRVNAEGPFVVEVAARSIGGICSRALRFACGRSLEELILRHSLGLEIESSGLEGGASGVMMIPIPRGGILQRVEGLDEAKRIPGVEDVVITAKNRQVLVPLPEGASYLGFIFARDGSPERVERALRRAHQALRFAVTPDLTVNEPPLQSGLSFGNQGPGMEGSLSLGEGAGGSTNRILPGR